MVIGFLVLALVAIFALLSNQPGTINPGSNFKAPTTTKVKIDNSVVNNFYKGDIFTFPVGDAAIEENNDYQISYIAKDKLFIVRLNASDAITKGLAEQALLNKLGIDKKTACNLNIEVHSYPDLNFSAPPQVARLSFCK